MASSRTRSRSTRAHRHAHGRARSLRRERRRRADKLPADKFFAPLAVISIESARREETPTRSSRWTMLLASGKLQRAARQRGAFVRDVLGLGIARIAQRGTISQQGREGHDARAWIQRGRRAIPVKERDIVGAGVDALSLDTASASKFVAHLGVAGRRQIRRRSCWRISTPVPPSGRDDHRRRTEARRRVGRPGRVCPGWRRRQRPRFNSGLTHLVSVDAGASRIWLRSPTALRGRSGAAGRPAP